MDTTSVFLYAGFGKSLYLNRLTLNPSFPMFSKASRYSLIAAACLKLGTAQRVNAVLYPSEHDTREEIGLARERDRGELPTDDDLPTLSSGLHFDTAKPGNEGEAILSNAERAQLARELAQRKAEMARRHPVNFVLVNS